MTEHIQEQECCNDFTQSEYLGMFDCQMEEQGESFFRSLFRNQQFRTKKVSWDEMKRQYANFHPAIMCDPCATAPLVDTSDMFRRHEVSGISVKSMIAIDCGEIENEYQRVRPGIDCNQITSPEEALRAVLARKSLAQSSGFDDIEECLAAEMVITQRIELPKSDYLPEGAAVWFPRDEELDCSTSEKFGKGQCDTWKILRNWMEKLECFEGSGRVTDVLMHCDTAEDMMMGDDFKECLKSYNPQLFLNNQMISQMTNRELIRPRGVTLFYTSPEGIRFWKVNIKKKFCVEDGTIQKYDLMPKNKLIGLDLSGSRCSYAPVWGYTPITDLKHLLGQGSQVQTVYASRYVKNTCTFEPAGWKQVMESNMLPFLPYANSSSCLTLCAPAEKETFKAPEPKVEATPVKKEAVKKEAVKEAK